LPLNHLEITYKTPQTQPKQKPKQPERKNKTQNTNNHKNPQNEKIHTKTSESLPDTDDKRHGTAG